MNESKLAKGCEETVENVGHAKSYNYTFGLQVRPFEIDLDGGLHYL
jgi:hypothetical protein